MALVNCDTANWLVERPILYKSAMLCMELPVASLEIDTATFTLTGIADLMLVSCLRKVGARVEHQYSNVETSIRMRPLNSLALNEPTRLRSKNPGCCNRLSWAHKRQGRLARTRMNPYTVIHMEHICCQCHTKITPSSNDKLSIVQYSDNCKRRRTISCCTSLSIFATSVNMAEKVLP